MCLLSSATTKAVLPRTPPHSSLASRSFLISIGFLRYTAAASPPPAPPRFCSLWWQDRPRATPSRRPGSSRPRACRTGLDPLRTSASVLPPADMLLPLSGWCCVDLSRCVLHPLFLLAYWIHWGNQRDFTIWHPVVTQEQQIRFCHLHPLETITCVCFLIIHSLLLILYGYVLTLPLLLWQWDSTVNLPKGSNDACVLIHLVGFLVFLSCVTLMMAV